jgi:Ca2+-binding RTX toxin-like protein
MMRDRHPARRRAITVVLTAAGLIGAAPAAAQAATLVNNAGLLTYTAAPGHVNDVTFTETPPGSGTVTVTRNAPPDDDPITAVGCTDVTPAGATAATVFTCTAVTAITANAADQNDSLAAAGTAIPVTFSGGAGDDVLTGAGGADTIDGGAGADDVSGGDGNDVLDGGADDDVVSGGAGTDIVGGGSEDDVLDGGLGPDTIRGGTGIDLVSYFSATAETISVTLDDLANDGVAGEGDNVASDVDDVIVSSAGPPATPGGAAAPGNVTVTGTATSNSLQVLGGNSLIVGGRGNDLLAGGPNNDTIDARDGFFDRVQCGGGVDTAIVDTLDVTSGCENVQLLDVGNANDDRPPAVAFTSPAPNARLDAGVTTLQATASDDKGVVKVQFIDDDRIVCEDTTAPYTCAYQPRGEDVGRNTLAVTAIDTAQQTATQTRTVVVGRFATTRVSLRLTPTRDRSGPVRFTASGIVTRPSLVTPASGCAGGTVTVTVKAGTRTISTRRANLRDNCTYRLTATFGDRSRFRGRRSLRVRARFGGNEVLAPRSSATRSFRVR